MQLNPYLTFNGDCEDAFKFYEKAFGGKIESMMTFESTPMAQKIPADWRKKIVHARLSLNGQLLMGSDAMPSGQGAYEPPKGFSVTIQTNKTDEAERVFHALAENGQVRMAIQQTFWAERFGTCVDRFGIPWMVNCEKAAAAA